MKLSWDVYELKSKHAFSIARMKAPSARFAVRVRVTDGDAEGWGEAAPNAYYGESADTVTAVLPRYAAALEDAAAGDAFALERIEHAVELAI